MLSQYKKFLLQQIEKERDFRTTEDKTIAYTFQFNEK